MAAGLFAAVPALGQGADDDPLPPLPPIDPNEEPPPDWEAWRQVPKLLGVSQADMRSTYAYSSDTSREKRSGEYHTTVFMELRRLGIEETGPTRSFQWLVTSATGFGSEMSTYSDYHLGAGHWLGGEGTTVGSYTGPFSLRVDPTLSFHLVDGTGGFSTLHETPGPRTAHFTASITELDTAAGGVRVRTLDEVQSWNYPLEDSWIDFTAPKAAVPFTGRSAYDGTTDQGHGSFRRTASFQFWPDWSDVEVRVELEDSTSTTNSPSYSEWRPEGNLEAPDQGGPRPLRLKATLRPKAEQPTAEQLAALPEVRRFRFELSDTSREPGVCMNWPSPPGTNAVPPPELDYDLRFIATVPEAMELSPKKTKAGVKPLPGEDPTLPSAWVLLECFDFGAHANLQVYADLADGRVIVGYLEVGEEKRYLIPIPDRLPGSLVAQKWRDDNDVTGPDSEDVDDEPVADGQKGDGFSVYEEYRGFRVGKGHVATDPRRKDLFIRDTNGGPVEAACRLLEDKTAEEGRQGLKVHERLEADEWHVSRAMNPNRTASSPRSSDELQHGLLMVSGTTNAAASFADMVRRPWRPKNALRVVVHPADNTVETIVHEIAHALGVDHHGDSDYYAVWSIRDVPGTGGIRRRFFEQRMDSDAETGKLTPAGEPGLIRIFREGEKQETLPDQSTNAPPGPRQVFIATQGGQHSGKESCFMRYNVATAHIEIGRPGDRIRPTKLQVNEAASVYFNFCKSCQGTGINPKRYWHALRGNCPSQLCVRDSAPERALAKNPCPKPPEPPDQPAP